MIFLLKVQNVIVIDAIFFKSQNVCLVLSRLRNNNNKLCTLGFILYQGMLCMTIKYVNDAIYWKPSWAVDKFTVENRLYACYVYYSQEKSSIKSGAALQKKLTVNDYQLFCKNPKSSKCRSDYNMPLLLQACFLSSGKLLPM